jgi:3-hydroxyacyl-[acyl-carrier-protein] dehydratase
VARQAERNSLYFLVGIDKARFKRPVVPGDQLVLDVRVKATKRGIWVFTGQALVDGKLVASAELMCTEREMEA